MAALARDVLCAPWTPCTARSRASSAHTACAATRACWWRSPAGRRLVALLHALLALGQRVGVAHVHHGLRGADADADLAFVADAGARARRGVRGARVDGGGARRPLARGTRTHAPLRGARAPARRGRLRPTSRRRISSRTRPRRCCSARCAGTGIGGLAAIRPSLDGGSRAASAAGAPPRGAARVPRRARPRVSARTPATRTSRSRATDCAPRSCRRSSRSTPARARGSGGAGASGPRRRTRSRCAELDADSRTSSSRRRRGLAAIASALLELDVRAAVEALRELAARAGRDRGGEPRAPRADRGLSSRDAASGRTLSLPRGFSLRPRSRTALARSRARSASSPSSIRVDAAARGRARIPRARASSELARVRCPGSSRPARCDSPARPPEALVARSPDPTDQVFARGRERRLKDVFASARWSREAQARAVVVERDGEIVWVPGLLRGESEGGRRAIARATRGRAPSKHRAEVVSLRENSRCLA